MTENKGTEVNRPRSDKIERNVEMANNIIDKITALGMGHSAGALGAHLSDICFALEDCRQLIGKLLDTDVKNKDAMEDVLIEIRIKVLDHINYHIKHVRRPLERVIDYCDKEVSTAHAAE